MAPIVLALRSTAGVQLGHDDALPFFDILFARAGNVLLKCEVDAQVKLLTLANVSHVLHRSHAPSRRQSCQEHVHSETLPRGIESLKDGPNTQQLVWWYN